MIPSQRIRNKLIVYSIIIKATGILDEEEFAQITRKLQLKSNK